MKAFRYFIKLAGINQISWLNPLFLGLLPAVILIWMQPVTFDPFLFEMVGNYPSAQYLIWYEDLENDGAKEKLMLGTDNEGVLNIMYYNDEGRLVNQHNFRNSFPAIREQIKPACADLDKDGTKEILFFSQNKDSLFLNVFSYKKEKTLLESRFVTQIGGYNEHIDYYIQSVGLSDVNNDSIPEYFFSVAAGFALYPRRLFRYNFANNELITSINTGAGHLKGSLFHEDDSLLLFISGVAYGNTREDYPFPYHDTTAWFFVFDKDLNFKTPPRAYGNHPGSLSRTIKRDNYYYCLYGSNNSFNDKNKLIKMNRDGEAVDSILFNFYVDPGLFTAIINNKSFDFFYNRDTWELFLFDTGKFDVSRFKKLKLSGMTHPLLHADLNSDGKTESVFNDHIKQDLFLMTYNLKTSITIGNFIHADFATSNFYKNKGYGELVVVSDEFSRIYRYTGNPVQNLKYPLWVGIYFISVLFVSLILYFQNKRNRNRQKLEQQLADMQLQNLRSQLDPHFTFNVLNTIGSFIYKQEKEKAYDLFQRFTRIIRSSLLVSDKVFRTLEEEIQFTRDYLEFQKIRFNNRFDYTISIDKNIDVNSIQFPKMLIQGYAENAVKHAFYGVDYTGQITIRVYKDKDKFLVAIEDNGIGINKSKELQATSGTQKGEQILQEQIEQINKLYHTNYSVLIQDKTEINSDKTGTRVTISVELP